MGQMIYPSSLQSDKVHSILFNINTIGGGDSSKQSSRAVENSSSNRGGAGGGGSIQNPYGNVPAMYTSKSQASRGFATYSRSGSSIVLQMPDNVGSSYGIEWKHTDFGLALRLSNMLLGGNKDMSQAAGSNDAGIWASTKQLGIEMGAGAVGSISGIDMTGVLQKTQGKIINPLIETIFKGVANRKFTFSFRFFPRNASESQAILKIITAFKRHMHPELLDGSKPYFKYPDTFDITFLLDSGGANPWLYKMSTSALVNLDTNETPESKYITHSDGAPVVRELTLQFSEMEQMHKEKFNDGNSH